MYSAEIVLYNHFWRAKHGAALKKLKSDWKLLGENIWKQSHTCNIYRCIGNCGVEILTNAKQMRVRTSIQKQHELLANFTGYSSGIHQYWMIWGGNPFRMLRYFRKWSFSLLRQHQRMYLRKWKDCALHTCSIVLSSMGTQRKRKRNTQMTYSVWAFLFCFWTPEGTMNISSCVQKDGLATSVSRRSRRNGSLFRRGDVIRAIGFPKTATADEKPAQQMWQFFELHLKYKKGFQEWMIKHTSLNH